MIAGLEILGRDDDQILFRYKGIDGAARVYDVLDALEEYVGEPELLEDGVLLDIPTRSRIKRDLEEWRTIYERTSNARIADDHR